MEENKSRLTLVGRSRKKIGKIFLSEYKCQCGKVTFQRPWCVNSGRIRSCGCLRDELSRQRMIGKPSKFAFEDPTESSFNSLYKKYREGAEKRHLSFCLPKEMFAALTKNNCFYCGAAPAQELIKTGGRQPYIYNGVDRKDNNLGYTPDNSCSCCGDCNFLKGSRDFESFIKKIRIINDTTIGLTF